MCIVCFNIKFSEFAHRVHLSVSYESENRWQLFSYTDHLIFGMETKCAFFDVGTGILILLT
jgi:hypothetical protein